MIPGFPVFPERPIITMRRKEMKVFHCWPAILAWSAISVAIQGQGILAQDRGAVVELGGLKARMPAGWVEEKPDDAKCYRQYRLEPVDDDKEYAQVTIC